MSAVTVTSQSTFSRGDSYDNALAETITGNIRPS
jgi:hypothetical protein